MSVPSGAGGMMLSRSLHAWGASVGERTLTDPGVHTSFGHRADSSTSASSEEEEEEEEDERRMAARASSGDGEAELLSTSSSYSTTSK